MAEVQTQDAHTRRFLALDALRGLAAMTVAVGHFYWSGLGGSRVAYHGQLAVDFFFILSGFVVSYAYEGNLQSGKLRLIEFNLKRVIRLFPMLWLGLSLGAAVATIERLQINIGASLAGSLFAIPDLINGQPSLHPLDPPAWSLTFELMASAAFSMTLVFLSDRALGAVVAASAISYGAYLLVGGDSNAGGGLVGIRLGRFAHLLRIFCRRPPATAAS